MNFSVRGLSVFLMVLQLFAPLIHAHKNELSLTAAFHLPEFEQINSSITNNSAIVVPQTQNDQVVTVSAGIKNKKRFLFDEVIDFFLTLSFFIATAVLTCAILFFNAKPIKRRAFNLAFPRAPPFSSLLLQKI